MHDVVVAGSGGYLPGPRIPFDEIDSYLGPITQAPQPVMKWIERIRPLMKEMIEVNYCHYAFDRISGQYTDDNVTMGAKAARVALESAGISTVDVEFIAYGSAHQHMMPTASVMIQQELGIEACAEISIHANCTSAYKAFLTAYDFIRIGRFKNALVISSGISSSELRASYYNQPLIRKEELFLRYFLCDGAGALVLKAAAKGEPGIVVECAHMESVGGLKPPAMLNRRPPYWMNPQEEWEQGRHHLAQMFNDQLRAHFHDSDGSVFYKGLKRMIEKYDLNISGLKFFQVNFPSKHIAELMIEECGALGIKPETMYTRMSDMGYPGPPMVFISLDHILRNENLKPGDQILSFVTEVSKFMQAGFSLRCRQ